MIRSKLKNLREQKVGTYECVGNLEGISKDAYWMIKNGKRGLSYERAIKIVSVFNLTPDDIFCVQS
ncbi:helix-turn-helix domain-containing protein [Secundilactobacillus mixtipabuli]|uniref:HTH cro/C1-type domain-containing protein n=1 Tax=Secundilactobacillus mixtipabuli TaxID=1435342 RepID=A0A1Z5IDE8_9LACO|nr:helix-turn-helix transcriptional regulator [Secundilactobacillus mixtipabuli]GAW99687.1 hypothetical protein IWT30_01657 [Secundilactobacillus mixtipabuli]